MLKEDSLIYNITFKEAFEVVKKDNIMFMMNVELVQHRLMSTRSNYKNTINNFLSSFNNEIQKLKQDIDEYQTRNEVLQRDLSSARTFSKVVICDAPL